MILVSINTGMQNKAKDVPALSISEVAEMLKISVETIRLYERKGLILTTKTDGNQRIFSESDVERIKCIRAAINEHKISIEGIRRIQSLIPCWEHIQCSVERREKCPAFFRTDAGCWTYAALRHPAHHTRINERDKDNQNDCAGRDCRSCKVYQLSGDCEKIKALIHHDVMSSL